MIGNYDRHPLSALMPDMGEEEMEGLAKDVSHNGVREPVWIYQGMVLDGWHRYQAAKTTGTACEVRNFKGGDPAEFVISMNIERRHLTKEQRAEAVVRLTESHWMRGKREITRKRQATLADTSTASIDRARRKVRTERGETVKPRKGKQHPMPRKPEPEPSKTESDPEVGQKPGVPTDPETPLKSRIAVLQTTLEEMRGAYEVLEAKVADPESRRMAKELSDRIAEVALYKRRAAEWQQKHSDAMVQIKSLQAALRKANRTG